MPAWILVVDDEPDLEALIRQRFRQQVRDQKYALLFARNGVEALRVVDQTPQLDLILTDLNMPEMDGLSLLAQLAERELPLKPVVISAYDDMQNIRLAMNRGAFDFVTKPIDFQDLEITIEKTLREVARLRDGLSAREHLAAVRRDLEVAGQIQQAILPRAVPSALEDFGYSICAAMMPAHHIGGDFYDYFLLDEEHLVLVVGDVSGKGIPAALLMAVSRSFIKATALTGISPAECVRLVNRMLSRDNPNHMFVTLFYAEVNLRSGEVRYCNAGHNLPFVLKASGELLTVPGLGGLVLGVEPAVDYETAALQLEAGDTLFLYTDGVTEAMNPDHELYGEERLKQQLTEAGPELAGTFEAIKRDLRAFAETHAQHDDITMLALRTKAG